MAAEGRHTVANFQLLTRKATWDDSTTFQQSPTRSVKGHLIRSNSTNHFAASPSPNPRLIVIVIVRCTAISFSSSARRYSISGHAPRTFPLHHRVSRSFVLPLLFVGPFFTHTLSTWCSIAQGIELF
jgi:hypothetical protein